MTSSQGLRPAKLLRVASLVRSSPLISAAFSFDRNDSKGTIAAIYERITLFVGTFIASDQIEEAKLSHANIPRSESRSFESDLRGGWKALSRFPAPQAVREEFVSRPWQCAVP